MTGSRSLYFIRRRSSALVLLLTFINIAAVPFANLVSIRQAASGEVSGHVRGTLLEMLADLLFDETGDAEDISRPLDEESGAKSSPRTDTRLEIYDHLFSLQFLNLLSSTLAGSQPEKAPPAPDRDRFVPPPRPLHTTIS